MTVSRLIILRMRNVSTKICRENQNTHFMFCNFFSENRDVYETMSKNEVETERTQMTIWRRVACRISKAARARKHIHRQKYIILIAFPRQQWFRERASRLRYTYIAFTRVSIAHQTDYTATNKAHLHVNLYITTFY